jgi:hypothetical protein
MSYNIYLDEVYTVGENNCDDQEDSFGNKFYDAISDSAILTNALDPISE